MQLISIETAFILFVVVLLVQSLAWTIVLRRLNVRLKVLDRSVSALNGRTTKSVNSIRETLVRLIPWTRDLAEWEGRFSNVSHRVLESARQGDQMLAKGLERLRKGTAEADSKLDAAVKTFSRYSFQVQEGVLHPSRQIGAVLDAVATVFKRFFSAGKSVSPEFVAEEEEFI